MSRRAYTSAQSPRGLICYIHKALKEIKAQSPIRIKAFTCLRIKNSRSLITLRKHHRIDFNRLRVMKLKAQSPFILRIAD